MRRQIKYVFRGQVSERVSVGDKNNRVRGFLLITAGTNDTAKVPLTGVGMHGGGNFSMNKAYSVAQY